MLHLLEDQLQQISVRYNQRRQELKILRSADLDDITFILKPVFKVVRTYRSSDSFIERIQEDSNKLTTDPLNNLVETGIKH